MRLPNAVHTAQPWVIAEIAPDFTLLDVWALPVEGSREDFGRLLEVMASLDPADAGAVTRLLFWVRRQLGGLLGWDDATNPQPIPGCAETTLSDRLPAPLRGSAESLGRDAALQRDAAFSPLYRTDDEWAAEISNDTVHGVLHLAWIDQGYGHYRGQLAVYVKPRGNLGAAYLKLISPFRHLIVYPAVMRHIQRAWEARAA